MKTKICSNCKVEKDVCDFGKKITTKDILLNNSLSTKGVLI